MRDHALDYDTIVDNYYERNKEIPLVEIPLRKAFIEMIPPRGHILDLACGPGRDSKYFSNMGFAITGVDASPAMVTKAKKVAPKASFHVMDMRKLSFDINSFDAVFFNAGLLAVEKKYAPQIIDKVYNLIAAGPLLLQIKEGVGEEVILDKRDGVDKFFAYYTQEEISKLLENRGFQVLDMEKHSSSRQSGSMFLTLLCIKA